MKGEVLYLHGQISWQFPKIYRVALRKITIDLLHFWDLQTPIYEKKNSAEVRLIYAEQISLYNFIIWTKNNNTAED